MSTLRANTITNVAGNSDIGNVGKILQVVQNIYKTDQSFSTTGSFFDTGLTATITPTSSSSKILIFAQLTFQPSNAAIIAFKILRGSTSLDVGVSGGGTQGLVAGTQNGSRGAYPSMQILDTPSYTLGQAIEYKMYARSGNASNYIEIPSSPNRTPVLCFATEIAA